MSQTRRLAAILAADVAGYSRLMGADEEGTLERLKALRRELLDPKIAEHHGRIVKTTGDGLLVEFASVVDAVRCAVEVQQAMAGRTRWHLIISEGASPVFAAPPVIKTEVFARLPDSLRTRHNPRHQSGVPRDCFLEGRRRHPEDGRRERTALSRRGPSGGEVGRLANDRLLLRGARSDQITDYHQPGHEPDADPQRFARSHLARVGTKMGKSRARPGLGRRK